MDNLSNSSKGFTLFEIAITSLLISVIAGMALPNYKSVGEKTRSSEGVQVLVAINESQNLYMLENNGAVAGNLALLSDLELPASSSFAVPVLYTANGQRAYVDRSSGDYRLYVDTNGNITCDDTPGWGGICAMMGIAIYPF